MTGVNLQKKKKMEIFGALEEVQDVWWSLDWCMGGFNRKAFCKEVVSLPVPEVCWFMVFKSILFYEHKERLHNLKILPLSTIWSIFIWWSKFCCMGEWNVPSLSKKWIQSETFKEIKYSNWFAWDMVIHF